MPLYEYQCGACGCRFEELVNASAKAPVCPSCGADSATRILSAVCGKTSDKATAESPASGPFPTGMGCGSGGFS